ncbi:dna methyltransferase : Adenine-specific DNA-methyltransferase OS=Alcanivorax pacificus W11-5 GN=S7S_02498 PE=4 SV=1: N6_Mtase [Gemmata massiliana]|uniref:site-specific DNA-methyltransferase (adenine-specific) n=1 Tax=Gemmata massiliana TaxID=1210884 RepID=A0A6P2DHS0_9BACT|nr:dna methyltransferase : Adenine-specific DNA-methyltransferase OS=Alcanivorax pacificus W11-5 GN=S7S_02498 PE=4 SV=1: N6_Mtase [Gemmata massiliana]
MILANPPYSIKKWDRAKWDADPYGRNTLGTPPQGRADYAFLQHILASLKPKTGRCSILFPHGVLFRDEEQAMREKLLDTDFVECVLGLGPNLFYGSPMEACILICRTGKPKARKDKVLFINAVNEVTRERSQSFLKPDHIERIINAYRAFKDEDGFCRVATREEIRTNHANLNIPLYVKTTGAGTTATRETLAQAIADWRSSSQQLILSLDSLIAKLEEVPARDRDAR